MKIVRTGMILLLAVLSILALCACSDAPAGETSEKTAKQTENQTADQTTDQTADQTEDQTADQPTNTATPSLTPSASENTPTEDDDEDEEEYSSTGLALAPSGEGYVIAGLGVCDEKDIVIPALYNGKPVVGIATYAFAHTAITGIVIPTTVEKIDECAFMECDQLKSVTFNEGLKMIDTYAFDHCESLTEIVFPASLEKIEYTSFSMCYSLKKVTFLGNTSIGGYAFDDCEELSEVIFAGRDGREYTIGFDSFMDSKIETIVLPEGLTDIDGSAFFGVYTLKTVFLPKSLKSVWDDSFAASGVEMIYYAGSADDWAKIERNINEYNIYVDPLQTGTVICDYVF